MYNYSNSRVRGHGQLGSHTVPSSDVFKMIYDLNDLMEMNDEMTWWFLNKNDDEYGCLSPNLKVQPQYLIWVGLDP